MTAIYRAIRVDMENNAKDFWADLREKYPTVAKSFEKNGCAVVSEQVYEALAAIGGFDGEPAPLIDHGSEGPGFADVTGERHQCLEAAE